MQPQRRLVGEPCPGAGDTMFAGARPGFGALDEREVNAVAVGRADAFRFGWDAGIASPGFGRRIAMALAALAGVRRVTPFADQRLETLRLFACMMRRGERGLDEVVARLLAAGFTSAGLHQATILALA